MGNQDVEHHTNLDSGRHHQSGEGQFCPAGPQVLDTEKEAELIIAEMNMANDDNNNNNISSTTTTTSDFNKVNSPNGQKLKKKQSVLYVKWE